MPSPLQLARRLIMSRRMNRPDMAGMDMIKPNMDMTMSLTNLAIVPDMIKTRMDMASSKDSIRPTARAMAMSSQAKVR